MRRYSWLIVALVVVAFVFIQRRPASDLPFPAAAQTINSGIRIPVTMTLPDTGDEYWGLSKKANKQYLVNVYVGKHTNHQFAAGKLLQQSADGTTYQTAGEINLGGTQYHASTIQVTPDGTSGTITLTKTASGISH